MSTLENFVAYCQKCLGKPYVLGDEGPDNYDCSGLPYAGAKDVFGKIIPRVSTDQYTLGVEVQKKDLIRGDFVFFDTGWTTRKPNHVGIYLGNDIFINANSFHGKTVEDHLSSSYWTGCWYGARRVFTQNGDFCTATSPVNSSTATSSPSFSDVPVTHPEYSYIMDLAQKGVITGDGNTHLFRPYDSINRAEAIKMVLISAQIPVPEIYPTLPFSDIPEGSWYIPYIAKGVETEIIEGYQDETFRPSNPVSRSEAVKMILTAFGTTLTPNVDENWDVPYLQEAQKRGMLIAEQDGDLRGAQPITRSEMCRAIGEV